MGLFEIASCPGLSVSQSRSPRRTQKEMKPRLLTVPSVSKGCGLFLKLRKDEMSKTLHPAVEMLLWQITHVKGLSLGVTGNDFEP